jgi:hypothetical protein
MHVANIDLDFAQLTSVLMKYMVARLELAHKRPYN